SDPARAVPDARLPGPVGGADAPYPARSLVVHDRGPRPRAGDLDVVRAHGTAETRMGRRYQLCHEVDEARHALARSEPRHPPGERRARSERCIRDRLFRRRLYDEPTARRRPERLGLRRVGIRRQAACAGARWPRAARRTWAVFLEKRQMGPWSPHPGPRSVGVLGVAWLSQPG